MLLRLPKLEVDARLDGYGHAKSCFKALSKIKKVAKTYIKDHGI